MSAELSKLQARVSAQERLSLSIAVRVEEVAQEVGGAGQVAEVKANLDELALNVERRFDAVDRRFESVDHQFKQVYGELADIKANMAEMRNLLATLVARSEK